MLKSVVCRAALPPSRSAVWTGEVLGLPEVFKDKEPAHRPKAAGTPLPVQEPGGLQGGGECPRLTQTLRNIH